MSWIRCDAHPGGCPATVEALDGVYCRGTGCLVGPAKLVVTDWTPYTNTMQVRMRKSNITARRTGSLKRRRCQAMAAPAFFKALHKLYSARSPCRILAVARSRAKAARKIKAPAKRTLVDIMRCVRLRNGVMRLGVQNDQVLEILAQSLAALARQHANPKNTYASLSVFPLIFSAAVMDKMVHGMSAKLGQAIPYLKLAAVNRVTTDQFKEMGVNCRAMSLVARNLKTWPLTKLWGQQLIDALSEVNYTRSHKSGAK